MLLEMLTRPCTLIRETESDIVDEHGNDVPSVDEVDTVCELQQIGATEPGGLQDQLSQTTWTIFLRPDEVLDGGDKVEIDGLSYEVRGDPWRVWDPETKTFDHIEAVLRRTDGEVKAS